MKSMPSYQALSEFDPATVAAALAPLTASVWTAEYTHGRERIWVAWRAIAEALSRLAGGQVPEPGATLPPWIPALARELLAGLSRHSWSQCEDFVAIRTLERLGVIHPPHDDDYVLAMVSGLGWRQGAPDRAEALRADPELIAGTLWRVFEVEGGGEVSLANVDKYSADEAGWRATFVALAADGTVSRARVLRECLGALGRDFSAYRAGWYSGLYQALAPTPAEVASDQARLRVLLRSDITTTVSLAARQLVAVERAGLLEDEETVIAAADGFASRTKGTPIALLGLLDRIVRRRPELGTEVVAAAVQGLDHPHGDVQGRALALLRGLDARDEVADRLPGLQPSVRTAATEWLGVDERPEEPAAAPAVVSPRAVMAGAIPADELAERTAILLEDPSDPAEIERVLAAMASLENAPALLGPLTKRARAVHERARQDDYYFHRLRGQLAELVLVANGIEHERLLRPSARVGLLVGRLTEVAEVLSGRRGPAPLLAVPTDPAGWLDPATLVNRLAAHPLPAHHDFVAALLRLAPDGREQALRAAADLPGEPGAALRYALGGSEHEAVDRFADGRTGVAAWWVAAARARTPFDDVAWLIDLGLDKPGQGRAARYDVAEADSWERCRLIVTRPSAGAAPPDQPTVVPPWSEDNDVLRWYDWFPWAATVWPPDAEYLFADGVQLAIKEALSFEVCPEAAVVLDALTSHPGRLGRAAALTLGLGLTAGTAAVRLRAVDAFASLLPAGRIDAAALAQAMADLDAVCTPTRWAASFRDAAEVGPDSAGQVIAVLTGLLPRLAPDRRGLHALLTVLHEESLRLSAPVTDGALRSWLGGLGGSSKAARTARALLALSDPARSLR